jgi:hypothetical protein
MIGRQAVSPGTAIVPGAQASAGKMGSQAPSTGVKPSAQASAGVPTVAQVPSGSSMAGSGQLGTGTQRPSTSCSPSPQVAIASLLPPQAQLSMSVVTTQARILSA